MRKKNKAKIIISSIIILLPILAGIILWDRLPDVLAIHWGVNGKPDGWTNKATAVTAFPLLLLFVHLVCIFITSKDPKNQNISSKLLGLVLGICPAISVFISFIVYSTALGKAYSLTVFIPVMLGLMFIIIGNYMPKCKQSRTLGIKIKWTLENEENWNATHRFSGKLWVAGGFVNFIFIFFPDSYCIILSFIYTMILVFIPVIYSYNYHIKHK